MIVAIVLGLVGYIMSRADFPMAPAVLGLVLGSKFETEFRRALQMNRNSASIFFTRPIACALIVLAVVMIIISIVSHRRSAAREAAREAEAAQKAEE